MHPDPLLTQAELDFIQSLLAQPAPAKRQAARRRPAPDLAEQLGALLEQLGADQQLSLDTHGQGQHLSYPLHLIREGHQVPRLELGAPLILETGETERPWRLRLAEPITLLGNDAQPGDLQVLELSSNGMLVSGARQPAATFAGRLQLPDDGCVRLQAQRVRRVGQRGYAYHLQPQDAKDEQQLREFLFTQHSGAQAGAALA